MKKFIAAALSILALNTSFAQDNDEDAILRDRIALDGSPMPGGMDHDHDMPHQHWNHLTTIAISPFQYTESGVGVGLSYERAMDPDGILSLYVPAIASFRLRNNNNYDPYYYGYNNYNRTDYTLYLMPGVKFYPTGMGKCKYAVGPNAVIGYGQRTMEGYHPYYNTNTYTTSYPYIIGTYDRWMLGMMINNSLNVNATPHLYIGAEMGFGFTYFDRIGGYNYGVKFLTQGSFKIGYTF